MRHTWILVMAVLLAGGVAGAYSFASQKDEAVISYVTYGELDSMLSFLPEFMTENSEKAKKVVTGTYMKELLQNLGLAKQINVTEGNEKIARENVLSYYEQVLDYLDLEEAVAKQTLLVLSAGNDSCTTNSGTFRIHEVLNEVILNGDVQLEPFHSYDVYMQDQVIIGIGEESEDQVSLENATVTELKDEQLTFSYNEEEWLSTCAESMTAQTGDVGTLYFRSGKASSFHKTGQDASASAKEADTEQVLDYVRVLLLNQDKIYYDQIYLTCSQAAAASGYKNAKKTKKYNKNYKKNKLINIQKLHLSEGGYAVIKPAKSNAKFYITDESGNKLTNGYYGSMYIYRDENGYYLVNKIKIEKYLYSVIASEMPASFGTEALKAQAVCARSYVYRQLQDADYKAYHADIDDSTNYQVYNKSEIAKEDIQAVKETAGLVMYSGDEIVNAYYFSSSCGFSSGMEIWNKAGTYSYLKTKSLLKSGEEMDLSDEDTFRTFITATDLDAYDSSSRYFRWNAKLEAGGSLKEIKEKIHQRRSINPENIIYYSTTSGKSKKVSSMKGFGGIENISCSKRSSSGAILELTIRFEYGKVKIMSEYNIRSILGCAMEQITYADGSTDTASRFLPSAYFTITFQKKSGRYILSGGGNGHGVGMSQYGAGGMAKEGWDYKKILQFYYDGIDIRKIGKSENKG